MPFRDQRSFVAQAAALAADRQRAALLASRARPVAAGRSWDAVVKELEAVLVAAADAGAAARPRSGNQFGNAPLAARALALRRGHGL